MSASDIPALLAERAEDVCRYLLPNGVRRGREWKVGSVHGEPGDSMGVVLAGEKAGQWADFASGESGDLIGLWKAVRALDAAESFREAEEWLGIVPRANGHRAIVRAVAPQAEPSHTHPRLGQPSQTWAYRDAAGGILGYISRFDPEGDRKQILPQSWDGSTWSWKAFAEPRPLYGLAELAARPDANVLVVEGEKCADVAARMIPAMVVVSWPGGCKAVDKVDLEPLRGRVVTLWPDADAPGSEAMERVAARLEQPCRIVRPNGYAEGWDIADAAADGWDSKRIVAWAREHIEEWFPPPAPELIEETHEPVSRWQPPAMLEGEWPQPLDLFGRAPLPELRPEYLPPALKTFVFDQSAIIGADPCILAISALVCASACTHDSIQLQPKQHERGWRESARLWGAFVGDPSVKKTPAANRAISHVKKLNIAMAEEAQAQDELYAKQSKAFAAREAQFYKDSAAGKPCESPGQPPEKPKKRRLMTQDATIEAVGLIMQDNPGGILIYQDELAGFFGGMDAYRSKGGKDAPFWLQAYNGGSMAIDRVGRGSIIIPNVSACVLGGIQPSAMRAISSGLPDDGLLQRFMIVTAQEVDGLGDDRSADHEALEGWRSVLDWLVSERADPDAPPLRFSMEAYAIARSVEEKIKAMASNGTYAERFRYHVGKWSGLFCRLCLTYHAIGCADRNERVEGDITADTAGRVALFMLEYLKPHTLAFYADVAGHDEHRGAVAWLAGWILARNLETFTPSDAARAYRLLRGMDESRRRKVFESLKLSGWIRERGAANRWSPTRWDVNPAVHVDFSDRAEYERASRDSARPDLEDKRS